MVIDIHTHAWPEKVSQKARESLESYYTVKCVGDPTTATLLEYMDRNCVDVSVICAVASRPEQVVSINNWLFSVASGRLKVFASLHPEYKDWKTELKRIKKHASGIKFQPSFQSFFCDDESVFPIYEAIEKEGVPVLFHSGDELAPQMVIRATPKRLLTIKKKFPGMTMIAAHLGGFRQWEEVKQTLLGTDIYLDTSASFGFISDDDARYLLKHHRQDRVVFGTDFPFFNQKKDLDYIDKLGISAKQKEMILSQNARDILHI
ncbi:MAG: amidohydrolase family protein [Candidatus Omnitrophica bacterium]|jgi:hypothetical protein|nr:amidohydrolase family protein [Candidatus Omnitrophota bacterium]